MQLFVDTPDNPVTNRRYEIPTAGGASTSFTIPGDDPLRSQRSYWWDVTAINSAGFGPVSTKWRFVTRV